VREEVERLKDHAGAQAQLALLFVLLSRIGQFTALDGDATDRDAAGVGSFKLIQAA
jgi:hypothetical protein